MRLDPELMARKLRLCEAKFETRDRQRRAAIAAMRRHLARAQYLEDGVNSIIHATESGAIKFDILGALVMLRDGLAGVGIREAKRRYRKTPVWE